MNTSVYGNRDFKGNQIFNPRIHPVADMTALAALVPGGTGQQAWVQSENRPYWWNGTEWVSYSDPVDPGADFYGVRTHIFGGNVYNPSMVGVNLTEGSSNILTRAQLNAYPEITDERKLMVELYGNCGFFLEDAGYKRVGTIMLFIEIGTGLNINAHYGSYNHGWWQDPPANTSDGQLTPLPDSIGTPTFFLKMGSRTAVESVDIHSIVYGSDLGTDYFTLGYAIAGTVHDLYQWNFTIDMSDPGPGEEEWDKGLLMNVQVLTIPGLTNNYVYKGPLSSIEDPVFGGLPVGHARTIYF